jgi:GDPmannose 4,6-dehydratase
MDITDYESVRRAILDIAPDEIYNLAAQSHVGESFKYPQYTLDVNGSGVLRILEVIRGRNIRLYQASTSEMFGNEPAPQSEETRFIPRSPYGCAKLLAHSLCVNYRESYGVKASCGILFNHESPIRGQDFVTQKIARGIWEEELRLGNLEAKRDWGHAKDYVEAMWLMLQSEPDDFVVATGVTHTVAEFVNEASKYVLEQGANPARVTIDQKFYRPADVNHLLGDPSKIKEKLGWEPKVDFKQLVIEMTGRGRHGAIEDFYRLR